MPLSADTDMAEKRQIAIVLYPGMTALDAVGPYEVLKLLPDSELRLVAHEPGPVVTDRSALIIGATHSFEETTQPFLVLAPGSEANTMSAMADGRLLAWLKRAHETSTMTTSVCSGALILAAAGLLDGRRATTHWWALASLSRFGATAVPDQRVVRSGKIWTAAGVSAGLDLALELFAEIAGQEAAEIAKLMIEYDPRPPFNSVHPSKATEAVREKAAAESARLARNPRDVISMPKILWRQAIDRSRRAMKARA
jgi:transcriptional regulator GlxA family with amidase domain